MKRKNITALTGLALGGVALAACSSGSTSYGGSGTTISASPAESTMTVTSSTITEPPSGALASSMNPSHANELAQQVNEIAQGVIGMPESQAVLKLESDPNVVMTTRVVSRDGEDFPVTMDYSPTRVNLWIENGNVIRVSVG